ncbi:homocysteine S-methyltransferase [Terrisporobacter vanillatitrophus]|uniref:homocysteine S-methyltransferase n=1 Tax=Terrisporobacter vanillatitrophus TaxID=3058402 RepID=UPI00336931F4
MNPVEKFLKENKLMILDGALATELERRGCDINDSLWSAKILAKNPEVIKDVHYDYFASGADCAITASYQATIKGFVENGYSEDEARRLISKSVEIAKEARDEFWKDEKNRENRSYPIVAASVGPYGAYLADGSEYRGNYNISDDELKNFHKERIELLINAGADILACETIPCLQEAKAIVEVVKEFEGVYCWISFSCKSETEISDGTLISTCIKELEALPQVAAVGINCTAPNYVSSLIKEIKEVSKKAIVAYPNSGEEYDANTKDWHGKTSDKCFCESCKSWYEDGARLIGGCCRTTPEDIKSIADWAR